MIHLPHLVKDNYQSLNTQSCKKWSYTDPGKQEITEAIVSFVAIELQSLSVVESDAFRTILQKAQPRYTMPSRKYLRSKLIRCLQMCQRAKDAFSEKPHIFLSSSFFFLSLSTRLVITML